MAGRRGRPSGGPAYIREMGINQKDTIGITRHKPVLQSDPRPLETSDELQFMAEVKHELHTRFMASSFYLNPTPTPRPLHRYLDKYQETRRSAIDFSYLPQELRAPHKKNQGTTSEPARKKLRIESTLPTLDIEEEGAEGEEKEEAETKEKDPDKPVDAEEEDLSDDDYLEEGNDYIDNYFDNGEKFLDDSDDNLDDDAVL